MMTPHTFSATGTGHLSVRLMGRAVVACFILFAAGCASDGHPDLDDYVRTIKARPGGRLEPVPEIKTYKSEPYTVADSRSPFVADVTEQIAPGTGKNAPQPRNKEALENFPLDALKLVGHVQKDGEGWSVVTAPDGLVYRVQVGNYIGQNQGKIHLIAEDRIQLTELVPAPNGGWIEREASLALTE